VCEKIEHDGVRMGVVGPRQIRAVTHLDVDADGVQKAIAAVRNAL
jgi:threonine aldolase